MRHLLTIALIFAVLAASWDLTLGYSGIFNFAHIPIFALAAYASGVLTVRFDLPGWISLLIAVAVATLASVLAFVPVLRLRGIYIALITFVLGQLLLHLVLSQADLTGGSNGLVGIPALTLGPMSLDWGNRLGYYYAALLLGSACLFLLWRLVRSDFGLALVALRDNEDYAVSRGISAARHRLAAFVAGSVVAGIMGVVYVHYLRVASPEFFGFATTSLVLSMVLFGGVGTLFGPILGAVVLTFGYEATQGLGAWRFIAIPILIILTIRFFPGGVLGLLARSGRRLRGTQPGAVVSDVEEAASAEEVG